MSYVRKVFGLGIFLVIVFSVLIVPLALAREANPTVSAADQLIESSVGLLQATDEATGTVEATDEATGTVEATTEAIETVEATTEATGTVEAAGATEGTATPVGGAQQPAALPSTGAVTTPSTSILLVAIGGLILIGGLGLALTRRRN